MRAALDLADKTIAEQDNKPALRHKKLSLGLQGSYGDICSFTGLPSYGDFMSLFMFLQPFWVNLHIGVIPKVQQDPIELSRCIISHYSFLSAQ